MEIIPVLDIMGGVAVHAMGGRRSEYRPLESVFAHSSDPLELAHALPFERLYVADLDAIMGKGDNFKILEELSRMKKIMADVGIRSRGDFEKIKHIPMDVVIGTETLESGESLGDILQDYGPRVIVSLDIKDGKTISHFLPENPKEALSRLKKLGVERIIILDITKVGSLKGFNGEYLKDMENSKDRGTPGLEVYMGGGIRKKDISELERLGVKGVLVGTAMHKGMFP